jgi:periplasmic copper chaperone A
MMKMTSFATAMAAAFFPALAFAAANPVVVSHPWFRYLLPQIPAGGFMTLHNPNDKPILLEGVRSPACGMAMLHESISSGGTERMIMVKTITVPANGDFAFSPGGYHVMCMEPRMKVGETVPVTLLFQNAPPVTVTFPVYGASGQRASP